jgi:hypothetical protein
MRFDTITIPHLYPVQGTDAGTPILPREPIPFGAVMPAATLPEDGTKTRDRKPNPQKPEKDEQTDAEPEIPGLPEAFRLVFARDFATILKFLSVENHAHLFELVQAIKEARGVFSFKGYPAYYTEVPPKFDELRRLYEQTVFYHHTRPGVRFAGKM